MEARCRSSFIWKTRDIERFDGVSEGASAALIRRCTESFGVTDKHVYCHCKFWKFRQTCIARRWLSGHMERVFGNFEGGSGGRDGHVSTHNAFWKSEPGSEWRMRRYERWGESQLLYALPSAQNRSQWEAM